MNNTKENPLQAALDHTDFDSSTNQKKQSGPNETVMIGGHFPKSYKRQLRLIAAEEDTTSQALLEEALNLLFVKKGKAKIPQNTDKK